MSHSPPLCPPQTQLLFPKPKPKRSRTLQEKTQKQNHDGTFLREAGIPTRICYLKMPNSDDF